MVSKSKRRGRKRDSKDSKRRNRNSKRKNEERNAIIIIVLCRFGLNIKYCKSVNSHLDFYFFQNFKICKNATFK